MNLICELFGHKYDKKEVKITMIRDNLCEVAVMCPRCNKVNFSLVVPEYKRKEAQ